MRALLLLVSAAGLLAPTFGQNTTTKLRTPPSPEAAASGADLPWHTDVEAALAAAKESGRPVLWYVPTLRGSFMDRKPEIDWAMMAGPFSWPRVRPLLMERFELLKHAPGREEAERFNIKPYAFVEPGYVVLDADGQELTRQSELTTLHPAWFDARLHEALGEEPTRLDGLPTARATDLEHRILLDPNLTDEVLTASLASLGSGDAAGVLHLAACGAFWRGDQARAERMWRKLIEDSPDHPLAAKAHMELEGHGAVVRGQERYSALPATALRASGKGTLCVEGAYDEEQTWARSLEFLLAMQRRDGGWVDSIYDFGGTDGLPNVYVATSAICTRALLEAHARGIGHPSLPSALDRALRYLLDETNLNPNDTDELIWAHTFRALTLARWLEVFPDAAEPVREGLARIGERVVALQNEDGSWSHEYSNPFVTSEGLLALAAIRGARVEVEGLADAVRRGTAALLRCRTAEGAYTYGNVREGRSPRARMEAGVGRIPRGELALHAWDVEDARSLADAVRDSVTHEEHLLPAQKYDNHTRSFSYGGFFFFYDLLARAEAAAAMGGTESKRALEAQRQQVLKLVEIDGAFIDSHELGRSYGTGMALWILSLCD